MGRASEGTCCCRPREGKCTRPGRAAARLADAGRTCPGPQAGQWGPPPAASSWMGTSRGNVQLAGAGAAGSQLPPQVRAQVSSTRLSRPRVVFLTVGTGLQAVLLAVIALIGESQPDLCLAPGLCGSRGVGVATALVDLTSASAGGEEGLGAASSAEQKPAGELYHDIYLWLRTVSPASSAAVGRAEASASRMTMGTTGMSAFRPAALLELACAWNGSYILAAMLSICTARTDRAVALLTDRGQQTI